MREVADVLSCYEETENPDTTDAGGQRSRATWGRTSSLHRMHMSRRTARALQTARHRYRDGVHCEKTQLHEDT